MIDAKELRIGNLVFKGGGAYQILPVDFIYLYGEEDADFLEGYKPIPLTPELLIKCGFENLDTEYSFQYKNGKILIEFIPDETIHARMYWDEENSLWIKEVKFLHEVQNLYYAFENKELEVNL